MLTLNQEKYLATIPEDKKIVVQDFNPAVKVAADKVIAKIHAVKPDWNVWSMGSSELGIAGQNDIDINITSSPDKYAEQLPILVELFGEPRQRERLPMKWTLEQDNFEVELYLTDATSEMFKEHLDVFRMLKDSRGLSERYEAIKKSASGGSFRDYMRKKYEFFNELLESREAGLNAMGEGQDLR